MNVSCDECRSLLKARGRKPGCSSCKKPRVNKNNLKVVEIANVYINMLITAEGGISADAIRLILEIEEIENPKLFTQKLLLFLAVALKTQREGL